MSLGGPGTHAVTDSDEDWILKELRSGGYGVRFTDEDAVHRIVAPSQHGNTVVGLVVIRNRAIVYAEFDRVVYPWWGRSPSSPEYADALDRLALAVREGRRK